MGLYKLKRRAVLVPILPEAWRRAEQEGTGHEINGVLHLTIYCSSKISNFKSLSYGTDSCMWTSATHGTCMSTNILGFDESSSLSLLSYNYLRTSHSQSFLSTSCRIQTTEIIRTVRETSKKSQKLDGGITTTITNPIQTGIRLSLLRRHIIHILLAQGNTTLISELLEEKEERLELFKARMEDLRLTTRNKNTVGEGTGINLLEVTCTLTKTRKENGMMNTMTGTEIEARVEKISILEVAV